MEKSLSHDLYKRSCELEIRDCPSQTLSDFLHGYLSVYSIVRVYPWLESDFGDAYGIHERIREIARIIEPLANNKELVKDVRAGFIVDLMDAYQLYSDMNFLNTALDAAYDVLTPWGANRIVLPCRTPNICRLLCYCYYFTGEKENSLLASSLINEALGFTRKAGRDDLMPWWWWDAFCFYEDVVGKVELSTNGQERLVEERVRLAVSVKQREEEVIKRFVKTEGDDVYDMAKSFRILAQREFTMCHERYENKEFI